MIHLCTLEQVKSAIPITSTVTEHDQHLLELIAAASDNVESYLGRFIEDAEHTEYFDVRSGDTVFQLRGYPVRSITSVWNDVYWDYEADGLVSSEYNHVEERTGLLYFRSGLLVPGAQALKVTYEGGMGTDTADFCERYARITQVCVRRVIYVHRTEKHVGTMAASMQTGNVTWVGDREFLEGDEDTLERERVFLL